MTQTDTGSYDLVILGGGSGGYACALRAAELDCQTGKVFTSTNQSNLPMQRLCDRLGFIKSGYVENLDEGDPELIYVKLLAPVPSAPRDTGEE